MKNKLRKIVSVFCVLAVVITAFAAVGRNVKAETETQMEYTEEEIGNQFLELLTSAGFNAHASVQEDTNGNYVISFGSDNPGYYECTLTPTQVDYFMESSDNINPMLGKEQQTINEEFERDFLNPFVATDGNIHLVWQEKADDDFEIFYTNDEGKQYENMLMQVIEGLGALDDKNSQKAIGNLNEALNDCLEQDFKHSIDNVHHAVKNLEKTENTETINVLIGSVMDFAKTNILYAEYDLTFNNTYIQEAYEKYYLAVDKYEKGNYDSAVEQFKISYLKIVEAYEEKGEIFIGVDFGETVRISYTDYDSVAPEVFLNGLISVGWMEILPEENHVYYARSSNNGVSWWYFDATVHGGPYLTYWGMSSSILTPCSLISIGIALLLLLLILIILALIIILIKCHFFYGILTDGTYGPIDDPYLNIFSPYDAVSVGDNIFNIPRRICGGDGNGNGDPEPAPDLIVTDVYFSENYIFEGHQTTVYGTIKNQGSAEMSGEVYVLFQYDSTTIGEPTIPDNYLAAGYSKTVSVSWTPPTITGTTAQTYTIQVEADSQNGIIEGNEGNNIMTKDVIVLDPNGDEDGDDMSNWDEVYKYRTDPFIENDRYAILVAPVRTASEHYMKEEIVDMRSYLINNGWTDDNIIFLTIDEGEAYIDGDATHDNLGEALDALESGGTHFGTDFGSGADANDIIFIFFKDHGDQYADGDRPAGVPADPNPGDETDGQDGFICTYGDPNDNWNNAYFWFDDEFANELNDISYLRLILEVSCCHSGEFLLDCGGPGRLVLSSCQEDESAWGGVYVLYRGLMNAPTDYLVNDGYVSLEEAHQYEIDHQSSHQTDQHPISDDQIAGETFL